MNRTARRKAGVKGTVKTYNMSAYQVKDIAISTMQEEITKAKKEALDYATKTLIAAFVLTLHDKEGYGVKRLKRVVEAVNNTFECVSIDEVKVEELQLMCSEIGIELK